ncbi:MAG: hypothetical protein R2873_29585 [Caldilineaceae bacterium]
MDIGAVVKQMTLEEKAALCTGAAVVVHTHRAVGRAGNDQARTPSRGGK